MLKKEFDDLMYSVSTNEEFATANAVYMESGDSMDKVRFCELYGTAEGRLVLLDILSSRCRDTSNRLADLRERVHFVGCNLMSLTDIIRQGEPADTLDMDEMCRDLFGDIEYLRRKLEKGYHLSERDRTVLLGFVGRV